MINQKNGTRQNIQISIETDSLLKENDTIIIGLSGGPDSVFLLHTLYQLHAQKKLTLIAAHLDHQWRSDSYKDVQFCTLLAKQFDIPFETAAYSDFASNIKKSGSQEDCARQARRLFFESIQKKYNADAIALAHHAQDQQETFFIRLLRGSSLTGLIGIRPKNGPYIRPILDISKQEILTYLDDNGIKYLVDPTNRSDTFLRNRIRNHLIPSLKKCDKRFDKTFTATLKRLQETELFLEQQTKNVLQEICSPLGHVPLDQLKKLHKVMRQRVLIAWLCQHNVPFTITESFIAEIERFLAHHNGGVHRMHKTWSIKKQKGLASLVIHS